MFVPISSVGANPFPIESIRSFLIAIYPEKGISSVAVKIQFDNKIRSAYSDILFKPPND